MFNISNQIYNLIRTNQLPETGSWCLYYSVEYMQNPVMLICCVAVTVFQAAGRTIRNITHVALESFTLVVDSRVVAPEHTDYINTHAAEEC